MDSEKHGTLTSKDRVSAKHPSIQVFFVACNNMIASFLGKGYLAK
jgi:hypothetical protein